MKTVYSKDPANKKLFVTREFLAPLELTWKAWTNKDMLAEWWAPKPYKAKTKSIDFRDGGHWLYAMIGPNDETHWCRVDFKDVSLKKSFSTTAYFCDENGNKNAALPTQHWRVEFQKTGNITKVLVELTFDTEKDLETIIAMGFEQGFAMAHGNLDELLAKEMQTA